MKEEEDTNLDFGSDVEEGEVTGDKVVSDSSCLVLSRTCLLVSRSHGMLIEMGLTKISI